MFGSKLRSWMENHIVRPRKKGNKHKNATSTTGAANNGAGSGSQDATFVLAKKSATLQHNGNLKVTSMPLSPVLGSQNQASHGVISSPVRRREVSPIQCHTPSRYGWQSPDQDTITSPKSDNLLYVAPSYHHQPQRQRQQYQQQQHLSVQTAPNSKNNSSADKSPAQVNCSSSSISSLSWSTGSKEPSTQSTGKREQLKVESLEPTLSVLYDYTSSSRQLSDYNDVELDDANAVHYEEVGTLLRRDVEPLGANNFVAYQRPHSENLTGYTASNLSERDEQRGSSAVRYGRLLPSRLPPHASDSVESLHVKSECLAAPAKVNAASTSAAAGSRLRAQRTGLRSGACVGGVAAPTMHGHGHAHGQGARTMAMGMGAAPPHSLSSPESAYSTGYSTEGGTSPGAANYNPPEYYINMRTGTHYYFPPKSVNSLAIEAQRYKFGLNRIEEMSPMDDTLPKTMFGSAACSQLRASDLYESTTSALASQEAAQAHKLFESPSPRQRCRIRTNPWYSNSEANAQHLMPGFANVKATGAGAAGAAAAAAACNMRVDFDAASTTSTTSSGIKSCNELTAHGEERNRHSSSRQAGKFMSTVGATTTTTATTTPTKAAIKATATSMTTTQTTTTTTTRAYESSESTSSSTEVENGGAQVKSCSPHTVKRKHLNSPLLRRSGNNNNNHNNNNHNNNNNNNNNNNSSSSYDAWLAASDMTSDIGARGNQRFDDAFISDDEATLNEMIGKFDESYIYEKETDILSSDSDPTDCISELDTGQDAGDECDTDELLDIDFIDTSSMQEVLFDKHELQRNLGNCYYYNANTSPARCSLRQSFERRSSVRSRRSSRSFRLQQDAANNAAMINSANAASQRRRKRFLKTRKKSAENREKVPASPLPQRVRESRSVGGTPVCLRRKHLSAKERIYKTSPLSNRSNSLVFTASNEKQCMTIAESEKALLKADLEADMKYRQLIMEAESLLESMKNSLQSIPRDTPVASPRRLNPLANKRVEMLKHSEVETKKQLQRANTNDTRDTTEHELAAAINKRIEMLKLETASAPNSPKLSRCSPRKTHITNFINQNTPPEVPPRKPSVGELYKPPQSPQLQLNGRRLQSPQATRRQESPKRQSHWHNANQQQLSDSDQECIAIVRQSNEDLVNHNFLHEQEELSYNKADYNNRNITVTQQSAYAYCPHSEPLKRKIYRGSSTFERIKKNFDLALEIPTKQHEHTGDRQPAQLSTSAKNSINDMSAPEADESLRHNTKKQQILLSTIVDLKRSLEYQSYELSGLNGD